MRGIVNEEYIKRLLDFKGINYIAKRFLDHGRLEMLKRDRLNYKGILFFYDVNELLREIASTTENLADYIVIFARNKREYAVLYAMYSLKIRGDYLFNNANEYISWKLFYQNYLEDYAVDLRPILKKMRVIRKAQQPIEPKNIIRAKAVSEEMAEEIREEYQKGNIGQGKLAKKYGVGVGTINKIVRNMY